MRLSVRALSNAGSIPARSPRFGKKKRFDSRLRAVGTVGVTARKDEQFI